MAFFLGKKKKGIYRLVVSRNVIEPYGKQVNKTKKKQKNFKEDKKGKSNVSKRRQEVMLDLYVR